MQSLSISAAVAPTPAIHRIGGVAPTIRPLLPRSLKCRCNLSELTNTAVRLEDSVMFSLLERSLYSAHGDAYKKCDVADSTKTGDIPGDGSVLQSLVIKTEETRVLSGFFLLPDDMPFFAQHLPERTDEGAALIPAPVRPGRIPLNPRGAGINLNGSVWKNYVDVILPTVATKDVDDGLLAHALYCDLVCLRATSRRVHFAKFMAEAKFQASSRDFVQAWAIEDYDTRSERLKVALGLPEEREATLVRYAMMSNTISDVSIQMFVVTYLNCVQTLVEEMEMRYIFEKMKGREILRVNGLILGE